MTAKKKLVASQTTAQLVVINRRQLENSIMEALKIRDRHDAVVHCLYELQIVMIRIIDRTVSSIGKPTPEIISLFRGFDIELVSAFVSFETAAKAGCHDYAERVSEMGSIIFDWKESIQAALNGDVETLQEFIKTQTTEPVQKQIEEIQARNRAGRPKGTVGVHPTTETLGALTESLKSQDPTERWHNIAAQVIAILKEAPEESAEGDALKLLLSKPYSAQGNFLKERHRLYLKALKKLAV